MSNKPKLTPPEQRPSEAPDPFSPDQRASRLKLIVLLVFLLLVVTAFAVVIVLPDQMANKEEVVEESGRLAKPPAEQVTDGSATSPVPEKFPAKSSAN